MTDTQVPPLATPRVAAGALFHDDAGRVLLVKPTYKDGWDIPGGYVEPGESPARACFREVHEELGVEIPTGRLLVIDWAPHPAEGDKLLFVFDGGRLTAEQHRWLALDGTEIAAAEFHHPDDFAALLPDRLVRRLVLALDAIRAGTTAYAGHGAAGTPNGHTAHR